MARPKKKIVMDFKYYSICEPCAKIRGGKFPKGHICTVSEGKCPYCKVVTTIIPYVDFDWPNRKTAHLRD